MCNYPCHIPNHGLITTEAWRRKLLQKTYRHVMYKVRNKEYFLTNGDERFILDNKDMYGQ